MGNLKNCGTENSGTVGRNFGGCEEGRKQCEVAREGPDLPRLRGPVGGSHPAGGGGEFIVQYGGDEIIALRSLLECNCITLPRVKTICYQ